VFFGDFLGLLDRLCLNLIHLLLCHGKFDLLLDCISLFVIVQILPLVLFFNVLHLFDLLLDLLIALTTEMLLLGFGVIQSPLLDLLYLAELFLASTIIDLVLDLIPCLLLLEELLLVKLE